MNHLHPKIIQESSKRHWNNIQTSFRNHLNIIQTSFNKHDLTFTSISHQFGLRPPVTTSACIKLSSETLVASSKSRTCGCPWRWRFDNWKISPNGSGKQNTSPIHLVGGVPTPLKNMKVNWDDYSQYINGKIKNVPNHQPVMFPFMFPIHSYDMELELETPTTYSSYFWTSLLNWEKTTCSLFSCSPVFACLGSFAK